MNRRSRATRPLPGAPTGSWPGRPTRSRAAQARAREAGYDCIVLGDRLQGEAREVAAEHARLARDLRRAGPPRRDPVGRRADRHAARRRPRRPEPGICAGACHPSRRRQGNRRRSPPIPMEPTAAGAAGRPRRRLYRRYDPGAGQGARPRSRRLSRRQRFHGVFQRHRRFVHARSDVHQRHRLSRHRR